MDASRRDFVAAAVGVAAAAGAAEAQTPSNLRFSNPPRMAKPAAYSHVVEVNGPHRTVYLAGQTGIHANGKVAEGFRAQAVQVMENIKTALGSVGGGFEHVVGAYKLPDQSPEAQRRRISRGARLLFPEQGRASREHLAADVAPCQSGLPGGGRGHRGSFHRRHNNPLICPLA